jgi:hypothetical protein
MSLYPMSHGPSRPFPDDPAVDAIAHLNAALCKLREIPHEAPIRRQLYAAIQRTEAARGFTNELRILPA